ncbi:MAG: hypothetical protein M1433_01330 [Candidatus Parvarchaeota archaeon]|nr:hypothetical protein [Candidatus Parvarchaeota archaeon]
METISVSTNVVQYAGVMDSQDTYNFIKDTLTGMGYRVSETSFVQFGGNNYAITWVAKKLLDDYMAYKMTIKLDYRSLSESTAIQNGKQVKVNTGELKITIISDLLLDFLDKWTSGVSKFVRPIYDKMNQDVINQRKTAFENEIGDFKSTLKSHFGQ